MGDWCAVCEADEVWKRVALPDGWQRYPADERGLDPAEGSYLVPACGDCSGDVDVEQPLDETGDAGA